MYYDERTVVFFDGKFIKASDASFSLYSQSMHYGYGVFEGIRSYETSIGVRIFKEKEHYDRLRKSCSLLNIPFDYQSEELGQISYQLLELNDLTDAYIRPLVFCDPNMTLISGTKSHLMICAWKWDRYLGNKLLNLCYSSYQRPNPHSTIMEAKVSGHYVNSILATTEAKQRGYDEALLLDMHGNVAEASGANFFYEKDGKLFTPPAGHILPGITRATVLSICQQLDIPVFERYFKPEELETADAAFLCGTAAEIIGIGSINANPMNKSWEESLGIVVQQAYKLQVLQKAFQGVFI